MVIYTGLMLAALGGAMWLLGVRDVRCYTVTCLWPATFTSFQTGAISGFILLGLAAAWRWRRHELRIGAIAAVVVAAKLFVWPVGLWLIVTRRYRAAVAAAITFPALVLGSWAVIAFRGLGSYEHLLGILSNAESPLGFGIGGVAAATGVPQALLTACAAAAVVGMFAWLHRLAPPQLDRLAMMAAVLAMLLLSPILWMHYLILLVIPLALGRPGFSRLWVLPAVFQFASIVTTQGVYPDGNPVALCLCWCGIAAVVWCSAAPMLRARTPVSAVAVGLARS
jgi:alpha-1,2-mannosyltransferase